MLSLLFFLVVAAHGETMYQISESELTELEAIQKRQESRIQSLENLLGERESELSERKNDIKKSETLLMEQAQTIGDLEISFEEYENVVRLTMADMQAEIQREKTKATIFGIVAVVTSITAVGFGIYMGVK